ncbi:MAG: hypothetical protein VB108_07205 [Anaerolineaceae bacterium]|nr:hypothetical protein [Anaerolineaceae bacterium]
MLLAAGAHAASCVLASGTMPGHLLQTLALDSVEKEVIISFVSEEQVPPIFEELVKKHLFDKTNTGIAITLPMVASFSMLEPSPEKLEEYFSQQAERVLRGEEDLPKKKSHALAMLITDKDQAVYAMELAQAHGFRGGTILRAHGSAASLHKVLDMVIEPEKELLVIVTPKERGKELLELFREALNLEAANTGITALIDVCEILGLSSLSDKLEAK